MTELSIIAALRKAAFLITLFGLLAYILLIAQGFASTTAVTITPAASPVSVQQTDIVIAPDIRSVSITSHQSQL